MLTDRCVGGLYLQSLEKYTYKISKLGVPHFYLFGAAETNLTSIHEDAHSIPGCSVGWGSGIAVSCGAGHSHGWDSTLLWLWCRQAASCSSYSTASLETSICHGCNPKKQKKKKKNKKSKRDYFQGREGGAYEGKAYHLIHFGLYITYNLFKIMWN